VLGRAVGPDHVQRGAAAPALGQAQGRLEYRGLVCIADAVRFPLLSRAALAVTEQASYADRFVVSKADLADEATLLGVLAALEELNPGTPTVLRRGHPLGQGEILGDLGKKAPRSAVRSAEEKWQGWSGGRPTSLTLVPAGPVERDGLESFLAAAGGVTFRIKGFLRLEGGPVVLADCVEDSVAVKEAEETQIAAAGPGLTVILKNPPLAAEKVLDLWRLKTGTEAAVEK